MFRKSIVASVLTLGVAAFTFTSCDEETLNAFTQGDTVAALKEALGVGVNVAVDRLSTEGYFDDAATRIGLPQEAVSAFTAVQALQKVPGVSSVLNEVGLGSDYRIILFLCLIPLQKTLLQRLPRYLLVQSETCRFRMESKFCSEEAVPLLHI